MQTPNSNRDNKPNKQRKGTSLKSVFLFMICMTATIVAALIVTSVLYLRQRKEISSAKKLIASTSVPPTNAVAQTNVAIFKLANQRCVVATPPTLISSNVVADMPLPSKIVPLAVEPEPYHWRGSPTICFFLQTLS